jgi:hypothetical protein
MRAAALMLGLAACAPEPTADSAAEAPLPTLASIEGVITRSAPVQGDGIGTLLVGLFQDPSGDPLPVPLWGWSRHDVDVNADDLAVPYVISNVYPQDQPYYVAAIFDEDGDLVIGPNLYPTQGDLLSVAIEDGAIPPVVVDAGGTHALDLDLGDVSTIDWGPSGGGEGSGGGSGGSGGGSGETGEGTVHVALRASLDQTDDLVGDAHVWFFEGDPREEPQGPIFQAAGVPVDLTDAGAIASFTVEDVPTRADPLYVVAYLDVDGSGANGPSAGDPIALDGDGLPTALVVDATPVDLSLRLAERSN